MEFDIYQTHYMEALIREKPTVYSFLKDRYFSDTSEFKTEKVFVDYDDGEGNLLAPFVIPRVGKVPMDRAGYETRELSPAYIAPSRPLSIDVLTKRLAGESLVSTLTPAQREKQYLVGDLDFLDKGISRTEEQMCSGILLDNAFEAVHIGDKEGMGKKYEAHFYDGTENKGVFVPKAKWAVGTEAKRGTWYDDTCREAYDLAESGRSVTDLVVGSAVAELVLNDPWVLKMMDNRRVELGTIDPRWNENGVVYLCRLNFAGIPLDVFCYRGSYQVKDPKTGKLVTKYYFPANAALLAAPNTGKLRYGMVTQVEMDGKTYSRTGKRVLKHNVNVDTNLKETILTARPIAAPKMKNPWRACRDVFKV